MSRVFSSANKGASEQIITTPPSAVYNNLSAFSWSIWALPTASPNAVLSTMIIKDAANSFSPFLTFTGNGTPTITGQVFTTGTAAVSISDGLLTLNAWSNIVMTFNLGGDAKVHLYVNGTEIVYAQQQAATGTLTNDSAGGFSFGNDTFDDGWDGNLAEAAVWNTVLTGPQITSVAASTTGVAGIQTANLVGYWHLCGTASPEPDATVNGNNGVLSVNPPTKGADSPGFSCGGVSPYSVPDCRNYATFPNSSRTVNETKIYDVQSSSNSAVPGVDSRTAGAPVDCRIAPNIPENSRTPGLYGPGEN